MKKTIISYTPSDNAYSKQMTVEIEASGKELREAINLMKKYKTTGRTVNYSFFILSIAAGKAKFRIWEPTIALLEQMLEEGFEFEF